MAASLPTTGAFWAARAQSCPSTLPPQNLCRDRATGPGAATPTAHLWSGPSETGVRSHRFAHGHSAHLARARIASQTQKEISAQARSGSRESNLASCSAAASAVFAARIQQHLDRWGVNLRDLAWQTDNGSEFIGGHDPQGHRTGFPAALGDSQHLRIPPAAHTYQSDVETVHRLVEDEFFDLETFASRGEFLAKAQTYQLYFNLARPNSHKENQTPWQIIQRLAPRSPLELCLLPPVFLDYYLNDSGGYDVPSYP